jgi:aerobic C4-dicarboxylate transport protein
VRGGFAATLQSSRVLPLSGAGLLFGIDHSFATAASTTDVIGNSIAVHVLTEWERTFDQQKLDAYVNRRHALPNLRPIRD